MARSVQSSSTLAAVQETVHLRHDVRRVCRRGDAQEVVLFEILRRVVAEPLLDLVCKPIQILVALSIQARKNLYQVEDVGQPFLVLQSIVMVVDPILLNGQTVGCRVDRRTCGRCDRDL